MNYLSTILLFLICSSFGLAQNQVRIDSLLTQLPHTQGIKKADIYNELSWEYHNDDPEKAISYAEQALYISQKKDYKKGTAKSLNNIGKTYRGLLEYTEALKYFFLALPFYENEPTLRLEYALCRKDIGDVYKSRGVYKQAMINYHKAKDEFLKLNAKRYYAQVLCNLADVSYKFANYKRAQELALEGLKISRETGSNEGVKEAFLILSEVYANLGNYQEAYQYRVMYTDTKDSVYKAENALENKLISEKLEKEHRDAMTKLVMEKEAEKAMFAKQRRDNIQYSLILLFFISLFVAIFLSGKVYIPQRYVESLIFLTLLLVFRFILIILVSLTSSYTEGAPLFILFVNVILAILFMPMHKFLERRLKKRVIEDVSEDDKLKIAPVIKSILHRPKEEKHAQEDEKPDRDNEPATLFDN